MSIASALRPPVSNYRVLVEIVQSGQAGPYEDTIREAYLTYSHGFRDASNNFIEAPFNPSEDVVKSDVQRFVGGFVDAPPLDTSAEEHFKPRLDIFTRVSAGVWHVRIREPYND